MKQILFGILTLCVTHINYSATAQCTGTAGPNLLGAKGTFSTPFITVNNGADNCLQTGANTYSPTNNVGNALTGCSVVSGSAIPCSDYTYTA
ncbi:MAG: hypothetical protein ACOYKE_06065, partial [Ferruginibacter sp.]